MNKTDISCYIPCGFRCFTKERIQKGQIPKKLKGGFRASRKDILKSVGRKKGGRVGKPKGVGVAIKGFGKAMKNG